MSAAHGKRPAVKTGRSRSRLGSSRLDSSRIIVNVDGTAAPVRRALARAARHALRAERITRGRLEVCVVSAAQMARLHRQWLGRPGPTDVLTFDLREPGRTQTAGGRGSPSRQPIDGQIIVCDDVARRAAQSRGGDRLAELALYVVHGCLHLCGYDDRRRTDFARMHRREDAILTALGYGPVFSRGGRSATGGAAHRAAGRKHVTGTRRGHRAPAAGLQRKLAGSGRVDARARAAARHRKGR